MNKRLIYRGLLILLFSAFQLNSRAQDREFAQQTIDELCSEKYAGRGYINSGDLKAAQFISNRFESIGLKSFSKDYFQKFRLNVNTIPKATLEIDGKVLKPGYDFLVAPEATSTSGSYQVFYVSERLLESSNVAKKVKKAVKKGFLPVICNFDHKNGKLSKNIEKIRECNEEATLVFLKDKLTWSVSRHQSKSTDICLLDSAFDKFAKDISIKVEAKFKENYNSQNVIGYVEGLEAPDSFIIFCGHYDHLGKMGEATFYGANDNASGIAMLLDMASYFTKNPQKYSIAFIAFGGEEAGLVGSYNYVQSPEIPLSKTRFVFNMDLMGSGDNGATIVNGSVFKGAFEALSAINEKNDYLPRIKVRGKAANSDHYFFTEAGVPSFFIYLMGEYTHYHIPADNAENLHLGEYYDRSFKLIRDFIIYLNQ